MARILDGNICLGFSGPKSRIFSSDSGTQPHVVSAVSNHKYTGDASCMQFKSCKPCSHTLAAVVDNKGLQEFAEVYLSANITRNVTPVATARGNKSAGCKPGDGPQVRKNRSSESASVDVARCTLGEVLSDTPPDCSQLEYHTHHQGGLKMVLTRVSGGRPPKPASNSTSDEPFQLIDIQGNICKCFGCGLPLRDGPPRYGVNELDSRYCQRH